MMLNMVKTYEPGKKNQITIGTKEKYNHNRLQFN